VIEARNHLILALDVPVAGRAARIAQSVAEHVDAIKVHWPVILNRGLGGIRGLAELAPVIVDAKLSDIPNTNRMACDLIFSSGATGVICQGFAGEDSVTACVDAGGDVFVLVEMSHPGSMMFISEHSGEIALMAREAGATGIVAPGNRPENLSAYRSAIGPSMQILCPGIGAQGGKPGDAIASGADFEIVGRSIYRSKDPAGAARDIATAIAERISAP
jgi:orotidine-5'-phosphate decarboxylase